MLNFNRPKTMAEIAEEADKLRRSIHMMTEAYDLLKQSYDRLEKENAELKDQVERLTLDLFHCRG